MITLPEEILKLSNKELDRVITGEIKNSKYIIINDYIYRIEKKFGKKVILRNVHTNRLLNADNFLNYNPLTKLEIALTKTSRILEYLNRCPPNAFIIALDKLCSEIFDRSVYDISFDEGNDSVELIIYYPEITITNSHELSNTMRDIYIKFSFNGYTDFRKLLSISIGRTTYTDYEYVGDYIFSHVSFRNIDGWNSTLCFGDTDLKNATLELRKGKFNLLQHVLLSFEEYLSWESIEGTPYSYISKLNKTIGKYITCSKNYYQYSIYLEVLKSFNDFQYEYLLNNGKYSIKLSKDSIDMIEEFLTNKYPDLCAYLINGISHKVNSNIVNFDINDGKDTDIVFKGEVKKLKIIKTQDDQVEEPEMRIHRNILNQCVSQIESDFNTYILNKKLQENV